MQSLISTTPHFFLGLLLYSFTTSAFAIHKCVINGATTYSDIPCPSEAATERFTPIIPAQPDPSAALAQHKANQQQLDRIDKKHEQERRHSQQLNQQWIKHSKREQKEQEQRQQKCKRLEVQLQLARKRLMAPSSGRLEIDKIKEKDLAEQYRVQCK